MAVLSIECIAARHLWNGHEMECTVQYQICNAFAIICCATHHPKISAGDSDTPPASGRLQVRESVADRQFPSSSGASSHADCVISALLPQTETYQLAPTKIGSRLYWVVTTFGRSRDRTPTKRSDRSQLRPTKVYIYREARIDGMDRRLLGKI